MKLISILLILALFSCTKQENKVTEIKSVDKKLGRDIYDINCSSCHKLNDLGYDEAPSLTTMSKNSKENLLKKIEKISKNDALHKNHFEIISKEEKISLVDYIINFKGDKPIY